MKTRNTVLIALMGVLFGAGCASEKGQSNANPSGPYCVDPYCGYPTPPPRGSSGDEYYSGSTATLQASLSSLSKMFFNSNPNNPTDIRINIDLSRASESVIISFVDGGRVIEGAFGTVHPYSGHADNRYNAWVEQNGKWIWKGFFQDTYGAVVLIVDDFITQGDGKPADIVGGSIWFQNFNRYYPNFPTQGPEKMCWEISLGPFDCRTFLDDGDVSMTSSLYPNNRGPNANTYYEKLGEFTGIVAADAGF